MGMNKTGIATAPRLSKEMIESSRDFPITGADGVTPDDLRLEYIKLDAKIGSVPPPASIKGVTTTALQALKGEKAAVLIDKVAERCAFERTGTRLYEALILKCKAAKTAAGDGTLEKLERICAEELNHFQMLWECIESLGADPTVQTPSADVAAVASQGIPKVLLDPRTTFGQCLEAILIAELVDNDAWERLIDLAEGFNQMELAERFRRALAQEEEHLLTIRDCVADAIENEAGIS
jgi:bacterioferritin (cytochrome b1)